ncbi:MAG TPA: glycosyl hydrolase [Opitutus sp.]|nr:glycosyl hydrolase [Opitutus sp.]
MPRPHAPFAGIRWPILPLLALVAAGIPLRGAASASNVADPPAAWPALSPAMKPWVRWWWPGSAVDEKNLTRELEQFSAAGLGGVEITPIYGARGRESRYVDFLSPRWMNLLAFTGREAQRRSLRVDMATGTGWPFGGPWITEADSLERVVLAGGRLAGEPTGMRVKRAAPGGEGLVLDPYSVAAMRHYLARFTAAFADFPRDLLRAQFHDSFEYYDAGWSPGLAAKFRELNGYDLQSFAAEFLGKKPLDPATLGRVKSDYRETLAALHAGYLAEWIRWSHAHGWLVRNQSHGAPANLLDLYGAVDIPETEVFGSTPFPIPGLRRDPADIRTDQDVPDSLVIRMASSAAHVMGRPLASSETCTWLREHWKTALAFAKPEIDRLFACGINHIIYHGTCYSPADAPWPGWFFYASTEFQPTNTWWDDFSALNAYVARVQSILQSGRPDNDVLLYWPFADLLDDPAGLMRQFAVHDVSWLRDSSTGRLAAQLSAQGYSFDYLSDAQLRATRTDHAALIAPGGNRYRTLVVPAARRLPVETLARLLALAHEGATVIFQKPPEDVPGYGRLAERRARFHALLAKISPSLVRADIPAALRSAGIPRESAAGFGLSFIRRANDLSGHDYFFANLTATPFDGWLVLGTPAASAVLCNPLTGHIGPAALRSNQVYLQLAPGESIIVRTTAPNSQLSTLHSQLPTLNSQPYFTPAAAPIPLTGTWHIEFIKGGPELPPALNTGVLKSWTDLGGGEAVDRFAGTARYTLAFDLPASTAPVGLSRGSAAKADDWLLDLGDVRESARVRLNGVAIATAWSIPFRVRLGAQLRPGRNVLELDVTNLAANRIRDLDRRRFPWKIMREINLVDINYHPFDASRWPLTPSGLLGPVTLTPLRRFDPSSENSDAHRPAAVPPPPSEVPRKAT